MAPLTALVGVITSRIVMRQPHLPSIAANAPTTIQSETKFDEQ
jgi:hypothetical protein